MKSVKYILGIQSFANQDSGAAIVKCCKDGPVLEYAAISEERLIRKKHPYVFPVHSLAYCMDYFGLKGMGEIDLLVTDHIRIERWFHSGPTYNVSDFDYLKMKLALDPRKIRVVDHHLAHAASTFYASGFEEAAILIVDGNGSDLETTSYFAGSGSQIERLDTFRYHGIGAVYSAVTRQILGFGTGGEGKTMGLAPYGREHPRVLEIAGELDGIRNDFSGFMRRLPYSDVLNQMDEANRIDPLRHEHRSRGEEDDVLDPYFSRAAFDVQKETERVLVHLASDLHARSPSENLCLAGGVALNSVANKFALDRSPFDNLYVFPACSDAGIPLGLALWGYFGSNEMEDFAGKRFSFPTAATGIEYSDTRIETALTDHRIPYRRTNPEEVAGLIADGKIVGWFQGGSEYGPRALGQRSILADSRSETIKDTLNLKVKHREPFRPFAPSILLEHASEYFDLECPSPFMLLIAEVKQPERVPAISHVDHTARVQTVTREENPVYYDLIREFHRLTGVPCILNTSFNDSGEPIVETPEDAIICFLATEMDYLVLGDSLVTATEVDKEATCESMRRQRERAIAARRREILRDCFPGYDERERDRFITEFNKMAEWYTKYKCKYELEKQVLAWCQEQARIVVVGTPGHTALLARKINGFSSLAIVGFVPHPGVPEGDGAPDYPRYGLADLEELDYDAALVSSYEYNFEILERLATVTTRPVYGIYDNTSRSFAETLSDLPSFPAPE